MYSRKPQRVKKRSPGRDGHADLRLRQLGIGRGVIRSERLFVEEWPVGPQRLRRRNRACDIKASVHLHAEVDIFSNRLAHRRDAGGCFPYSLAAEAVIHAGEGVPL